MKSTPSRKEPGPHRTDAPRVDRGSSAGVTGGVPADEEDIGTEGAGTEPRDSTQTEGETESSSRQGKRPPGRKPHG